MNEKTIIIAEIGVNHNGSLELAKQLITIAQQSGADYAKFQSFDAGLLTTKRAGMAQYQQQNMQKNDSQYNMLKALELSVDDHFALKKYCENAGIGFLSTPFDDFHADLLVNQCQLPTIKIGSGDLTNLPLLYKIANSGVKIILSTGMADMGDIHHALQICHNAYNGLPPTSTEPINWHILRQKISLLHCITDYPAPPETINLQAIATLRAAFPHLTIGYSDHSMGIAIPVAAVAMGAKIIEKHLTISRSMAGPDHLASLEPAEFQQMVADIRLIEQAMGNGVKFPGPNAMQNKNIAQKSLVALQKIQKGDILTSENMGIKRPGNGLAPKFYWLFLGTKADRDYEEDELISGY